jgi:hypothetical protein
LIDTEVKMQNKNPHTRKTGGKANDVRWLITAVSLTSTLFFWYLFSRQNFSSVMANPDPQIAPPLNAGQSSDNGALTLSLPPMPTLIPPLSDMSNSVSAQPADALSAPAAQPQVNLAAPAPAQGPVKIMLGGSAPRAATPARNSKPAARTHSS